MATFKFQLHITDNHVGRVSKRDCQHWVGRPSPLPIDNTHYSLRRVPNDVSMEKGNQVQAS